jgi:hypothetical protein
MQNQSSHCSAEGKGLFGCNTLEQFDRENQGLQQRKDSLQAGLKMMHAKITGKSK